MADNGLAGFKRRLRAMPEKVKADLRPAVTGAAEMVAARMRWHAQASRDSGTLQGTITVTPPGGTTPGGKQIGSVAAGITAGGAATTVPSAGGPFDYSLAVEFGTKDAPAQPFFYLAVREKKRAARARIKRAMAKSIKRHWGNG